MKRKVIQLAGKTLVVSLPNKWAGKYNIKKGDEVEVEDSNNKLLISPIKELVSDSVEVDVSGLSDAAVNRILGAIYKAGHDEALISFGSHHELDVLLEVVREGFIGFEIVNRAKNSIRLKNVAVIQYGEFDTILRRMFLVALSMAEEGFVAVKSADKSLLTSVIFMDKDVNKYANFCRRLLNKSGYAYFRKTPVLYSLVEQLEKAADALRDICIHAQAKQEKPGKEVLELYSDACELLRIIYETYYKFDKNKVSEFLSKSANIKNKISVKIETSKKQDVLYLLRLQAIVEKCFDLSGPVITLSI